MSEAEFFEDIGGDFALMDFYAEHPDVWFREQVEAKRSVQFDRTVDRLKRKGAKRVYLVVADSRKKSNAIIFLQAAKYNSGGYWTQFLTNARVFSKRESAEFICKQFKFNNPRVMTLGQVEKELEKLRQRSLANYKR